MVRLIDAEAWKLELFLFHPVNENTAWIINRINHAPAVELIRCADCRHSATGNYFSGMMCGRYRDEHGMLFMSVNDNDFCSRAERKDNNDSCQSV